MFKTTIIEDTHLTLAAIPFKVEANNSLNFCDCKQFEKICQVFVSFQSIILNFFWSYHLSRTSVYIFHCQCNIKKITIFLFKVIYRQCWKTAAVHQGMIMLDEWDKGENYNLASLEPVRRELVQPLLPWHNSTFGRNPGEVASEMVRW